MEDEDEDVIFENSVLHQALIESGYKDIETEPRLSTEKAITHTHNEGANEEKKTKFICHDNANPISKPFIQLFIPVQDLNLLYSQKHSLTLNHLIHSQLLSEEDRSFLQYFIEDGDSSQVVEIENQRCMLPGIGFLAVLLFVLNVLIVPWRPPHFFTAILTAMNCQDFHCQFLSVVLFNTVMFVMLYFPLVSVGYRIKKKILQELEKKENLYKQLETVAWELMYLEKKCIRLLRETEIVSRGFFLATSQRVACSSYHIPGSEQWCQQFRETLLVENISLMSSIKTLVVNMMKNLPMLCQDSDFSSLESMSFYCADGSVQVISSGSPVNKGIGKEFQEKSIRTGANDLETISIAQLNKSVSLLHVYLSGFIRRLALCFYVQNHKAKNVEPFTVTQECVRSSIEAIQKAHSSLSYCYKFRQALHLSTIEQGQNRVAMEVTQTDAIYTCLRTSEIRSMNALEKIRLLKQLIEERIYHIERRRSGLESGDLNEFKTLSPSDRESFSQLLEEVTQNLDSSLNSCKMIRREINNQDSPTPEERPTAAVQRPTQMERIVRYNAAEESVVMDQEFEAVSTGEDADSNDRSHYSAADLEKMKMDRETEKIFRQELKLVCNQIQNYRIAQRNNAESTTQNLSPGVQSEAAASVVTTADNPMEGRPSDQPSGRASGLSILALACATQRELDQQLPPIQETSDPDSEFSGPITRQLYTVVVNPLGSGQSQQKGATATNSSPVDRTGMNAPLENQVVGSVSSNTGSLINPIYSRPTPSPCKRHDAICESDSSVHDRPSVIAFTGASSGAGASISSTSDNVWKFCANLHSYAKPPPNASPTKETTRATQTRTTPTRATPTKETPTRATPTKETPTKETPTRTTPTRATPTKETPTRTSTRETSKFTPKKTPPIETPKKRTPIKRNMDVRSTTLDDSDACRDLLFEPAPKFKILDSPTPRNSPNEEHAAPREPDSTVTGEVNPANVGSPLTRSIAQMAAETAKALQMVGQKEETFSDDSDIDSV
ncbi:vezatin [Biomphalaria pfeifferi]|uniref:Vezatin n=1 Tax=Biomphalaria pfeifferi TaxID=112525 RepID=A0AAD8EY83_BIOPF|nr:vezatin [Biomphalaria pfeifferi]